MVRVRPRYRPDVVSVVTLFVGWALVLGVVGGLLTEVGPWYDGLRKPSWQPPRWLFAPAWTLIFALTAWSGVLAWRGAGAGAGGHLVIAALFVVNGVFNLLWSPLFFKWKRPDWALAEIPFLWVSIVALMVGVAPYSDLAPWLLVPYLAWVSFAAALNREIVRLNAPF